MSTSTVRIYTVVYHLPETGTASDYSGAAGDGSTVARFRKQAEAERFAEGKSYFGSPAQALPDDVPRKLAKRWGLA